MSNKIKVMLFLFLTILVLAFTSKSSVYASTNISFKDDDNNSYSVSFPTDLTKYCILECDKNKDSIYLLDFSGSAADDGEFWFEFTGFYPYLWYFNKDYADVGDSNRASAVLYHYNVSTNTFDLQREASGGGDLKDCKLSVLYSTFNVYLAKDDSGKNTPGYLYKASKFPKLHIEYYEPYSMYYVFTDWYDVRNLSMTSGYAYGKHTEFNEDKDDFWLADNMVYEYKENEEGNKTITREGFPLNVYSYYSFFMMNLDTKDWEIKGIDFTEEALKGSEYENCLDPFTKLNLYLDTVQKPPVVYSNLIKKETLENCPLYTFEVSFDNGQSYSLVDNYLECIEEVDVNGIIYCRFYYKLFANDTYTLKLTIIDTSHEKHVIEKTFTISSYDEIIDIGGNDRTPATPFITAYADSSIIRFSTQTFKERINLKAFGEETPTLRYDAYYIDAKAYEYFGDNYEDWILMDTGYEDFDKTINATPYYFKTEFEYKSLNDGDVFYFVFYDRKLGCFSNVTKYTLESKSDLLLISQDIKFNNEKMQQLYDFFKQHFGFLTYPLEFVVNLFNRMFNINYEEPVLHFPQIINPVDDTVIFEGFDYNLNSMLEYKPIAMIYNIYLAAVDFILVCTFVIGCKNTLEEVFGNG